MRLQDEIKRMMGEKDALSKLKLDIIRMLAIFNGVSWMSEIIPDILKFRGGVLDYSLTDELLEKALRDLESDGLILVEPRMRGMFPSKGVYEDKLIKLKDLRTARRILTEDEIYRLYLSKQMNVIRQAMKELK